MFGGEIEHVTMIFQNRMIENVMDRLGVTEDERQLRITMPVAASQQLFG